MERLLKAVTSSASYKLNANRSGLEEQVVLEKAIVLSTKTLAQKSQTKTMICMFLLRKRLQVLSLENVLTYQQLQETKVKYNCASKRIPKMFVGKEITLSGWQLMSFFQVEVNISLQIPMLLNVKQNVWMIIYAKQCK